MRRWSAVLLFHWNNSLGDESASIEAVHFTVCEIESKSYENALCFVQEDNNVCVPFL